MEDSAPLPPLVTLMTLLAKPSCFVIAKRMVRRFLNNCTRQVKPEEPTNGCFCLAHTPVAAPSLTRRCTDFHWTCILQYLSSSHQITVNDKEISKLSSEPHFFSYPIVAQQNFLLLLKGFVHSIPTPCLYNFISTIESHPSCSYDTCSGNWLTYLLKALKCQIGKEPNPSTHIETLPFQQDSIDRISEAFNIPIPMSMSTLLVSDCVQETSSSMRQTPLKRVLEEDNEQDTRESKRQRTETTCCVEVTEVSVQKELQSIELTEDQTKGAESSVSTRLMTDGGSEQNQLDDKSHSIISKWKAESSCEQSDFDGIIASPQFTIFLSEASAQLYTDKGIVAIAENLLKTNIDIAYLKLVACFKELLANKILGLQKTISRVLIVQITSIFKRYSLSFVDGFLSSLICNEKFSSKHRIFVCKLISSSLSEDQRTRLYKNIMENGVIWNDHVMQIVLVLIDKGVMMMSADSNLCQTSIHTLETNAHYHNSSLVFTKILLSLVSKYGNEFTELRGSFKNIVNENKTCLKLTLLKHLE